MYTFVIHSLFDPLIQARRDEINRVRLQTISHNTTESLENLTPPPRKTSRVQATRNLSLSLENVTGATPTSTPKQSRVSHPQVIKNHCCNCL